jgi:hypothetical protein
VQPFENMTATLIPIDGGYKRRVNRPAASAVAKASGEGSFLRAKEGGVREGGGRAGRIGCKPLHLLALPGARASGRFISLPLRQLPLNMLKESLVDVPKPCRCLNAKISGRRLPFSPADKGVLTTAGEFSDTLVEMADDELVAE